MSCSNGSNKVKTKTKTKKENYAKLCKCPPVCPSVVCRLSSFVHLY